MRTLVRWDEEFSTEDTNEILTTLALEIIRGIPESADRERIAAGITSRDYSLLCNTDLAYEELSAGSAIALRQCLAFFSKRKDLDIGVDRTEAALRKFYEAERLCGETNAIFKSWSAGRFQFRPAVESVLHGAQRKIAQVLEDVPAFDRIKVRFGPGATTQVKKRNASARQKLAESFACSEEFLGGLQEALEELPAWIPFMEDETARVSVEVHSAKLDFVPKNAKIDRAIAVEPMLNSMFQLGYGDVITHNLSRSGIDLRDQTRNQRLAREGSLTGALATLDLSSASDTIATELVSHLLPVDWFLTLSRLRSGTLRYKDDVIRLQKFSSMGNGFTFPLESLIFYSLAYSSCLEVLGRRPRSSEISVYGDDIIVPVEVYPLLCEVLHSCGFVVNREKSFASGPFRESCGKDYLKGIDIRPCYIKDKLSGMSIFVLHNFFHRNYEFELCDILRNHLHPSLQIFGPDGYGDGHLLGNWVARPHRRAIPPSPLPSGFGTSVTASDPKHCGGWGGYTFDTFTLKKRRSYRPLPGDCVLPAYSIYAASHWDPLREMGCRRAGYLRSQGRIDWSYHDSSPGSQFSYSAGKLGVILPGSKGYKRISIYTLAS